VYFWFDYFNSFTNLSYFRKNMLFEFGLSTAWSILFRWEQLDDVRDCFSKIEKESSFFSLFLRIDPFLLFDWLKFYFSSSNESTENVTLLMLLVDDDLLLMFLSSFLLISKGCSIFLSYFSGKWVFFLTIGFLFEEVCLKRFFFFILFLT